MVTSKKFTALSILNSTKLIANLLTDSDVQIRNNACQSFKKTNTNTQKHTHIYARRHARTHTHMRRHKHTCVVEDIPPTFPSFNSIKTHLLNGGQCELALYLIPIERNVNFFRSKPWNHIAFQLLSICYAFHVDNINAFFIWSWHIIDKMQETYFLIQYYIFLSTYIIHQAKHYENIIRYSIYVRSYRLTGHRNICNIQCNGYIKLFDTSK